MPFLIHLMRRGKGTIRDFSWSLVAQVGRILLQALSFLLLARILRADGYGQISGLLGFIGILIPFSGWGAPSLALKYISQDVSQYQPRLAASFGLLAITGPFACVICIVCAPLAFGHHLDWAILVPLLLAELLFLKLPEITAQVFQAVDRLDLAARPHLIVGISRLTSIGICLAIPGHVTAEHFSLAYCFTSLIAAGLCFLDISSLLSKLGKPTVSTSYLRENLREGASFSVALASKSVYTDIDKTMLARMVSAEATGFYTASYRVTSMALIPAQALIASIAVKLFRTAQDGPAAVLRCALKLYPPLFFYAVAIGTLLVGFSPLMPRLLGPTYKNSIVALQWLAWMPVIQVTHFLLGDTLMAIGRQGLRSACQTGAAILNIGINLLAIPMYSWRGAVVASYMSEGFLAISMIVILYLEVKKENNAKSLALRKSASLAQV